MFEFDIILDNSRQNLKEVPPKILDMSNLKMLYLQQNFLKKLPTDFFLRLPSLTWLDLRNNHLTKIPESIAHHQHLENLLLTDNKIQTLPNELGLVPSLKVLQIANNPVTYPNTKIISSGTRSILSFLKNEYEKEINYSVQEEVKNNESREFLFDDVLRERSREREINIENYSKEFFPVEPLNSSLVVKSLSKDNTSCNKIVHKMSKDNTSNKVSLKSYYEEEDDNSDHSVLSKNGLKEEWLLKIRDLLEEQEVILQHERNLQALGSWREKKKSEPVRPVPQEKPQPPYGTYPEYDTILSREDLARQIDRLIERNRNQPKQENIQRLINDVIGQLKEMETTYSSNKSPRSEVEDAGKEIKMITEVHKKLLWLQNLNNKL